MKKEFYKITYQDIDIALDFFDGNELHFSEFLLATTKYYRGQIHTFKYKIVEKYFRTYKKTMDFIIEAKKTGKIGGTKASENQSDSGDTLIGSVEGTITPLIDTLIPNNKIEISNNKEEIIKIDYNKLILEYSDEDLKTKNEKIVKLFHNLFDTGFQVWKESKMDKWLKDLESLLKKIDYKKLVAIYTELGMQKMQFYPCDSFQYDTYKSIGALMKKQKDEVYVYEKILTIATERTKNEKWLSEFKKNNEKIESWN